MQEIKLYVAANGALGVIRDYANAKGASAPTLVRGCEVILRLRLFANTDGDTPYPIDQLRNIVHWQWVMDKDFDSTTAYVLQADNGNITVDSVTDNIDDIERTFTEISIPLVDTNTQELVTWLDTAKSKNGLHGELVGFDSSGDDVFVLQIENFTFRNRITALGEPTEIDPDYLTAAQVEALVRGWIIRDLQNPMEYQFSADGATDWHTTQTESDLYFRQRIANIDGEWSPAIMLARGAQGKDGADGYTPVKGTDYWTDADKREIKDYVDSAILNGEW